ncbi:hypothetical protein A4G26_25395 [Mycobacterium kansasii]|nr:hypothetical protein A4G26_25395 [Mycobacterium kansasii]
MVNDGGKPVQGVWSTNAWATIPNGDFAYSCCDFSGYCDFLISRKPAQVSRRGARSAQQLVAS